MWEGVVTTDWCGGVFGVMEMFQDWTVGVVVQLCRFTKAHCIAHFVSGFYGM